MLHDWLRSALASSGIRQAELSRRLSSALGRSIDKAAVNKMVKGPSHRRIAADELIAISEITGVPAPGGDHLATPIVGYVGAGNEAHYYDLADSPIDEAPMPPGGTEKTVAVVVRGDSMMGWADDGDLIYFEDVRSPVTDDLIGKRCVVGTADGRILVKRLARRVGDPSRFILTSYNAEPLIDVPIIWAAKVKAIVPR